jgi:hypothetical protein
VDRSRGDVEIENLVAIGVRLVWDGYFSSLSAQE